MNRIPQILVCFALALVASGALYHTSDRVRDLDHRLHALNASIEAEQQNIHVLNAEWVYLTNPARIEDEARRHMVQLKPTQPKQMAALDAIPVEAAAHPVPKTAPIAVAEAAPRRMIATRPHNPAITQVALTLPTTSRAIAQTASAQQLRDPLGTLIAGLGSRP